MRQALLVATIALSAGVAAFGSGCFAEAKNDTEGSIENLEATDLQMARTAVSAITERCTSCHTAGRDEIVRWGAAMKAIEETCLAPTLTLTPAKRVACLRDDPSDATSSFSAGKLGLYSAGVALPEIENVFKTANPTTWRDDFADFKSAAGMPMGNGPRILASDFATIKKWVLRGLPGLDEVMNEPGSAPCEQKVTPELLAHLERMKVEGWGARHAAASTPMAGCGAATSPADCFTSRPDLTPTLGPKGTVQTLRELRKFPMASSFWTRSSADGRFAAFGGQPSRIVDLEADVTAEPIKARAPYDPGFFPNNDGFSFAGTQAGGLRVCRQSVLLAALASPAREITFAETGCTKIIDTVYQSVGAALDGSLFFMATGTHTNDSGTASGPLSASFGANSKTTLTPMFNDGTRYVPGANVLVDVPFEGDQQMSPSNTLLITRFGQKAGTSGYRFRSITPTITPPAPPVARDAGAPTDAGAEGGTRDGGASTPPTPPVASVSVTSTDLGTVCLAGGKPQLSFDERFLAVHQYTDPNHNPDNLPAGTANIFVMDLKTGTTIQVTNVKSGQKALYPHFRADGWLYFIVRESSKETLVGSDVVLHRAP